LWNLQGRRSFNEVKERRESHIESLVALAYLQRRTFKLEHQEPNGNWSTEIAVIVHHDVRLREPLASYSILRISKEVTVTTRPDEMKIWEELLRQFDLTNSPTPFVGPLVTRVYNIDTETFIRNLKQTAPRKTGESNQDLLLRFFKDNRVEIHKPSVLFLDEKEQRLIVRTTEAQKDKINDLIHRIMNPKLP
jgi:hypothetical protein